MKEHADIHYQRDNAFFIACDRGYVELVKYLLTAEELEEHIDIHTDKDYGFSCAAFKHHYKLVEYLIFDMNIEKNKNIKQHFKKYPNKKIEDMFGMRDKSKKLEKIPLAKKGKKITV